MPQVWSLDELEDALTRNSHADLPVERRALREDLVLCHVVFGRHVPPADQGAHQQRLHARPHGVGQEPEMSRGGFLSTCQTLASGAIILFERGGAEARQPHEVDAGRGHPVAQTTSMSSAYRKGFQHHHPCGRDLSNLLRPCRPGSSSSERGKSVTTARREWTVSED